MEGREGGERREGGSGWMDGWMVMGRCGGGGGLLRVGCSKNIA